jgi:multidrug efflux pump subunit AcrB
MVDRLNRERRRPSAPTCRWAWRLAPRPTASTRSSPGVELPPGVRIAEAGDAEVQAELMVSFGNAMIMGLMLVLTVLILLFGSVIQPFTILLSLPLAIGGVAAALILTNSALSMPVLIGILMLMGIVTKNAILLIDFAIEMRARGMTAFRR